MSVHSRRHTLRALSAAIAVAALATGCSNANSGASKGEAPVPPVY